MVNSRILDSVSPTLELNFFPGHPLLSAPPHTHTRTHSCARFPDPGRGECAGMVTKHSISGRNDAHASAHCASGVGATVTAARRPTAARTPRLAAWAAVALQLLLVAALVPLPTAAVVLNTTDKNAMAALKLAWCAPPSEVPNVLRC